jgi:hypothetical protein
MDVKSVLRDLKKNQEWAQLKHDIIRSSISCHDKKTMTRMGMRTTGHSTKKPWQLICRDTSIMHADESPQKPVYRRECTCHERTPLHPRGKENDRMMMRRMKMRIMTRRRRHAFLKGSSHGHISLSIP